MKLRLTFSVSSKQITAMYLPKHSVDELLAVEDEELFDYAAENAIFSALLFNGMCVDDPTFKCFGSIDGGDEQSIEVFDEDEHADGEICPTDMVKLCGGDLFEDLTKKNYSSVYDELSPSVEYDAVILEQVGYKNGRITIEFEVDKGFKWSDISLIWRSLEWSTDEFIRDVVYPCGDSELEVLGVAYRNQFFDVYDYVDFAGGASSWFSCYIKTSDGDFELIREI